LKPLSPAPRFYKVKGTRPTGQKVVVPTLYSDGIVLAGSVSCPVVV